MLPAEDCNEDLKYTVKFTKGLLEIVGGWPLPHKASVLRRIVLRIRNAFAYFLFLFTIVPGLLQMFLLEKSSLAKIKLSAPVMNCGIQCLKFTILLYRSHEIRESIDTIGKDWENATKEDREILLSKAKIGRKVVLIIAITMYVSGMTYRTITPLTKGTIITADNRTIRPLAIPVYLVCIDEQITPIYEIVFILQFFAGVATYALVSASCGVCAFLVLHVCSLLKILVNKMRRLTEKENLDDKIVQRMIADIVQYQVKIKEFLTKVETITEYICLVETVGGVFLICIEGYMILVNLGNTVPMLIYATIFYALTFSLFMLCYISQLLGDESHNVGQTSNTLDWYRLPTKHARSFVLIIAKSNSPKLLTAGKMVDMSLATFTNIMKMSMGYLNILREVI